MRLPELMEKHSWDIYGMACEGYTNGEIGEVLGVSSYQARVARLRLGAPRLKRGPKNVNRGVADKERMERMIAAREAGQTYNQIGSTYGISRERVRQLLNKAGRSDLCYRRGPGEKDPWVSRKKGRALNARVSRILRLRRERKTWPEIGAELYPDIDCRWGGWRAYRAVKLVCERFNLDPSPAFFDLRKRTE